MRRFVIMQSDKKNKNDKLVFQPEIYVASVPGQATRYDFSLFFSRLKASATPGAVRVYILKRLFISMSVNGGRIFTSILKRLNHQKEIKNWYALISPVR